MAHLAQLRTFNSFAVYTDIIDSQITGSSYSDCLRLVAIKEETVGQEVIESFQKPYFLKLNKRYITSITILVKDIHNQFVDFKEGIFRVKLRFVNPTEKNGNQNY